MFSSSGGSGNFALNLPHSVSLVGEVSGFQANRISGTTQNLTLLNYLFGGRYAIGTHTPLRLYGQALFGVSHENSNYTYVQSVSAFALSVGGGARLPVGRHLGLNLVQADWLHSTLPNGGNSRQNDLRLSAGFYFVLGSR